MLSITENYYNRVVENKGKTQETTQKLAIALKQNQWQKCGKQEQRTETGKRGWLRFKVRL